MNYIDAFRLYVAALSNNNNDIEAAIREIRITLFSEDNCDELIRQLRGIRGGRPVSIPGQTNLEWYEELDSHEYWRTYKSLLEDPERRNFPECVVNSIDQSTQRIINYLADPMDLTAEPKYGLVVGHVQSGKTANYSGLIARAADTGYKLVIVLTGGTSDLRNQTQKRLSKEVTGTISDDCGNHVIGSEYAREWNEVTKITSLEGYPPNARIRDEGDVSGHLSDKNDSFFENEKPILIVMKKIGPSFDSLNEWLQGIPEATLQRIPLLFIDDESDYASVNTSSDTRANRINEAVRTTLSMFEHRAYVAYTATPFANVFAAVHEDQTEWPTLFPRDFIVTLPEPQFYCGYAQLFPPSEYDAPYPYPRLCEVSEDEAGWVRNLTDTTTITSELGIGLRNALMDHLITSALRSLRNSMPVHQTMLVHTHRETNYMHPIVFRIKEQLKQWKPVFSNLEWLLIGPQKRELEFFTERYRSEFKQKWTYHDQPPELHEIKAWINAALRNNSVKVLEVSSDPDFATNELDYDSISYSSEGLNVIAVGGQRLSRGLTLEGLTVSYFIRTAAQIQYDNLMQMGRWFGYRVGYDDLIRIHSTFDLIECMRDVGGVEAHLRTQIELHEEQGWTPTQFGLRVLKIMNMIPCRSDAMRNINITSSSDLDQTIVPSSGAVFDFENKEKLRENLRKTSDFISQLGDNTSLQNRSYVWEGITNEIIVSYFDNLCIDENSGYPASTYEWGRLRSYIQRRIECTDDEYREWDVALISKASGESCQPLSEYDCEYELVLPERSRKNIYSNSIGTIHQPKDTTIGLEGGIEEFYSNGIFSNALMWQNRGIKPLLLLYIFDKESQPLSTSTDRVSFFTIEEEKIHVVIPVLVLPSAVMTDEEREYEMAQFYSNQELPLASREEVLEGEIEE